MHIIIAVITAIAGLVWALNSLQRAGFDLNSLNPFYWFRRKRWEEKQVNPLHSLERPRDLAGLLMFAVLRQAGDPTEEQKTHLMSLYSTELKFSEKESSDMYSLASYLISTDPNYTNKVPDIMALSLTTATKQQLSSIPDLVHQVATHSNSPNSTQVAFIESIEETINRYEKN